MGWSSTSPFQLKNIACVTCRVPGLQRAVFFLGDVGYITQHSVLLAEGQINASVTCQPFRCDREVHWLDFSDAGDGW